MQVAIHRTLCVVILAGIAVAGCERAPSTYASDCATPLKGWGREQDGIGHLRTVQPIYVTADGSVLWNKVAISDAALQHHMAQMSEMDPEPQAVLEIAPGAACSRVAAVRAIMDAAPLCQGPHPLCSEGRDWERWP